MFEALSDNVKNLFGEVQSRLENVNVLEKAVLDAQVAKEKARNEFAKFLKDVDNALHKIIDEVGPVLPEPAPVDPNAPPAT